MLRTAGKNNDSSGNVSGRLFQKKNFSKFREIQCFDYTLSCLSCLLPWVKGEAVTRGICLPKHKRFGGIF